MRVLGYRKSDFTAEDGTAIKGFNVFIGSDIDPERGEGLATERVYMSDNKLERNGIDLVELLEKDVKVYFNKFGKVDTIVLDD